MLKTNGESWAMNKKIENRIISRKELKQIVPYSDVHILRLERKGRFPARIKLGPNRVGWCNQEIYDWIAEKKAERSLDDALESHVPLQ